MDLNETTEARVEGRRNDVTGDSQVLKQSDFIRSNISQTK